MITDDEIRWLRHSPEDNQKRLAEYELYLSELLQTVPVEPKPYPRMYVRDSVDRVARHMAGEASSEAYVASRYLRECVGIEGTDELAAALESVDWTQIERVGQKLMAASKRWQESVWALTAERLEEFRERYRADVATLRRVVAMQQAVKG
jgi:hypothetical protein